MLKKFRDPAHPVEFALACAVFCAAVFLGLYYIDAGTISAARAAVISDYLEKYPGILSLMKEDRERAYKYIHTYDMSKDLTREEQYKLQHQDVGEDTVVAASNGDRHDVGSVAGARDGAGATDTYLVRDRFPRLIRKQILGSLFGDEPNELAAVGRFKPQRLDFNPKWFFYGGAYTYPVAVFIGGGTVLFQGTKALSLDYVLKHPEVSRTMYSSGRFFGVLTGLAAVILLGLIVSHLFGPRAACLAVTLSATLPYLVMFGHLCKPYTTAAMWAYLSVFMTMKFLAAPSRKSYYLSAIFAGLAFGSNYVFLYYSGIMIVARALDLWNDRATPLPSHVRTLTLDIVRYYTVVIAAFLASNPYWLYQFDIVRSELAMANPEVMKRFESIRSMGEGLIGVWRGIVTAFVYAIDYPLVLISLATYPLAVRAIWRGTMPRRRECLALAVWGGPFIFGSILYNAFYLQQSMHYMGSYCILYFVVLGCALWPVALDRAGVAGLALLLVAAGYNTVHTALHVLTFKDLAERNEEFGRFLAETLPEHASITTMLAVSETSDSDLVNLRHPPQVWTSAILPDFNFFEYDWRLRVHILPEPDPMDAEYILDTIGDAWATPRKELTDRYELVAERRRKLFVPGSWQDALFPRLITTYDYKDIQLWRKK